MYIRDVYEVVVTTTWALLPTLTHELVVQTVKLGSPSLRRIRQQDLATFCNIETGLTVHGGLFHVYTSLLAQELDQWKDVSSRMSHLENKTS